MVFTALAAIVASPLDDAAIAIGGKKLFGKKKPQGNLPLIQWNQGAFPFQNSPGHNYDTWYWPYPAQTNQYTYFNAFVGNQLPNFSVAVPRIFTGEQLNRPWVTSTNKQQQNALQSQHSGVSALGWSQQGTANYISSMGQIWSMGGGGDVTRFKPISAWKRRRG